MKLPKEEINRKLLHMFALVMPIGIYCLQILTGAWYYSTISLALFVMGSIIIERLRFVNPSIQEYYFKYFGSMLRKEEQYVVTGSTWIAMAALICSVVFRKEPWVSLIVLTLFILGDAVAALVGISIGRIKIGKKSLEGSVACFILCIVLFYAVFNHLPNIQAIMGGTISIATVVVTSFTITLFELIPLRITPKFIINDNLAVPIIAGFILRFMVDIGI